MQRHQSPTRLAACRGQHASAVVAACTFEIRGDGKEVKLTPAGEFRARDGRPGPTPWKIDGEIAQRVIQRAAERATDIVIDYEHQTLHSDMNGQPAPAAGWFSGSALAWREGDGLYATDVRWTERARSMIEAGEYRYVSPVFAYLPDTGEVLDILHVALTNDPALDGLPALAEQAAARFARFTDRPEEGDTVEKLRQLLGLAQDATEEQVNQAVTALKAKLAETLGTEHNATAEAVGEAAAALKAKADQVDGKDREIATLKANSGTPDPAKYAPIETVQELQTEVARLKSEQTERSVAELVEAGLEDGRLLTSQKDWAYELGRKDLAALKKYLDNTQPIAALRGTQTGGQAPAGAGNAAGELTEAQEAICTSMGLDREAYKKSLGIADNAGAAASQ